MSRKSLNVAVLLCVLAAVPLYGQTPSGEISGVITDASGSVLPGVTITLTNMATNAQRMVQTNKTDQYMMPALQPGVYSLKAELSGFRTIERANLEVQM